MARELLIAWLNDAYAIEEAHVRAVRQYIRDFEEFIEIRSDLRQHLADTEEMVTALEEAIVALGGKIADLQITDTGITAPASVSPYHDELVKNLLLLHAATQYGYISYMAIADAANQIEEDEIADMCERAAEEKRTMAEWTEEQLPTIVANCLKATTEE